MTDEDQDKICVWAKKNMLFTYYSALFVFYVKVILFTFLTIAYVIWKIPGKVWDYHVCGGKCHG